MLNGLFSDKFERRLTICVVSHNGYGAITGGKGGFVGGVERQTSLLARWMRERGHHVRFLTWDEGGPSVEMIDGVRIIKICREDAGLPGLRFFHPKWTGLTAALTLADADVYYQNCGDCVTGQMALWCRWNSKPLIFSLASDADCNPTLPELHSRHERLLYRYGLRCADRRVVQTETQRVNLAHHFGVDSEVIRIPAPGPEQFRSPDSATAKILWIGRVCRVKRPDRLVEIARFCPDLGFEVAGPIYEDDFSRTVAAEAETLPNIRMLGPVARERVSSLYHDASVLCCTSEYEGFPNTFLEAWSHGLPVVSTVDPDGVITRHGLGRIAGDSVSLVREIRYLLADKAAYAATSRNAREYYLAHHAMEAVMPRFEGLFMELATASPIQSAAS